MRNLTPITDHGARARARLYDQHSNGTFADQVEQENARLQEIEDALYSMISARYIGAAVGQWLTDIGDLVNEPRPTTGAAATDDDVYRARVLSRIAVNISEGKADDIYNILTTLGAGRPRVQDLYPAGVVVSFTYSDIIDDCACIRDTLKEATAPVTMDLTEHSNDPFGFAGDTEAYGFGVGEIGRTG